jgi:Domain of unknown function (DUF4037)
VRTFSQVGTPFVAGAELGRRFYAQAVRPLLDTEFPGLPHAAAHLGQGSDVLGYDTAMSRDHDWGPAVTLFLPEAEAGLAPAIRSMLDARLPDVFCGYPTGFATHPADPTSQVMTLGAPERRVRTTTVRAFARRRLGWDPADPLSVADWLSFPSQELLGVTAGRVHYDGIGELTRLRERLAWYPIDLWRYLLAAGWTRLGEEEHLMGRAGHAGDELGSAVIGGRLTRDLMALGFLLERRFAPYPKWFGTAFARLELAAALRPVLDDLIAAPTWPQRQDAYAAAAGLLVRRQNELDLCAPVDPRPRPFYQRPFWVIDGSRVAATLVAAVVDPAVRRLTRRRLIGSVDQWSDSTDLKDAQFRADVRRFYG